MVTISTACAESPAPPDNVTVYEPEPTLAIMKDPLGAPLPATMLQAAEPLWTAVPEIEQLLSCGRKPVPETVTLVPGEPLAGFKVICGPESTVNVA